MCTMASWVPATRIVKGSMTLKKFVDTHKLEKIVTVTGGHYATSTKYDFSEGQVLKLIRKDSIIVVRTCKIDGAAGEVVQRNEEPVTIPRDFKGELEVVPMSSDTFRCKVVDQLFKRPLPLYITPTVAFKIGEVTIEAGTGLKILKTNVSPTSETTLECIQLKDGNKIKIPLGTFGQFKLRWEKHYVTVNDIYDRLPQKVKTTMMRGCNIAEPFPGLPANHVGPFYLDKIDVVEVAIRGSKDKPSLIPVSLDIHVQQSDVKINDFNPGVNIHKLIHTSSANLPMVVQVTNDNKGAIPGIEPGSKLVIHRVQQFEAVLATTDANQDIMIPCSYKGGFERVPAVFETAEDMWIGAKNKYVQATERYRSENIDLYSVATGDILKPTNMLRVTLSGENEERDVLLCHKYQPDRQASVVKIPLYARCMFKEVVLDEGNETEHTINEITHLFGTPLLVRPSKITSDCEAMSVLTAKTPITLGDKFDYSLIAVSKYPDNDSPCFAIPEFTELIVRELDVTVTKKPHSVSFFTDTE
ncbi:protein THEMIS-like [Saccoglossus kowalevskii]